MILIDMSNVMMTNLHSSFPKKPTKDDFHANQVRHLILNMIRVVNHKFRAEYGEIVICVDSKSYWRKKVFPYYKAHRKADRNKLEHIEWPVVFELFDNVKDELREWTKWPVIEVEGAEGDDVIGVLANQFPDQKHVIISRDRDFQQLQAYNPLLVQYDPVEKRMLTPADKVGYLEEHILYGDRNDGVPNVLSDDDVLVTPGKRQNKMTAKRLAELKSSSVDQWVNKTYQRNWKRNQLLVDLRCAPPSVVRNILQQYEEQKDKPHHRMYKYLVHYKLTGLLDVVDQF